MNHRTPNRFAVSHSNLAARLERVSSNSKRYSDYNALVHLSSGNLYYEDKLATGRLGGRTIAVKDNIAVKGWPLSCASNILTGYVSPYHATVVERMLDEGAVIVAKANHDEFAMGSSNEHSSFGPAKNPVDPTKVPGGSSGGSAISVALRIADFALGSDTGGSVRQPAAFCGIYGMKPTYGRVSRYGLVAFASSFDQVGVLAKTTDETALILEVISGHDPKDSTSAEKVVPPYVKLLGGPLPARVGVPWEFLSQGVDEEILEHLKSLVSFLEEAGCEVTTVRLDHSRYAIATYYILTTAEASSNLARYDGIRYGLSERGGSLNNLYQRTRSEGFGEEVKRRIMMGTYVLSSGYYDAYYRKAQKVRRLIRDDYVKAFRELDVIILPTTPTPAFDLGENLDDPLKMYLSDIFTTPISLAGIPALNIPVGNHSTGLPIGMQIVGNFFAEETILNLSHYIEHNFSV